MHRFVYTHATLKPTVILSKVQTIRDESQVRRFHPVLTASARLPPATDYLHPSSGPTSRTETTPRLVLSFTPLGDSTPTTPTSPSFSSPMPFPNLILHVLVSVTRQ